MPYSPWVEQDRNLVLYPRAESATGWTSTGPSGTSSNQVTGGPLPELPTYRKLTTTTSGSGAACAMTNGTSSSTRTVVLPNTEYTFSIFGMASSAAIMSQARVIQYDSAGTSIAGGTSLGVARAAVPDVWGRYNVTVTTLPNAAYVAIAFYSSGTWIIGDYFAASGAMATLGPDLLDYYDGSTPSVETIQYSWSGTAGASPSIRKTRTIIPPIPSLPIRVLSTSELLYGDRTTSYRWEVLTHTGGVDVLAGVLDGVSDGSLTWVQNAAVKGGGNIKVVDLETAAPGLMRIKDLPLESIRVRPVCVIQGLPENPLGVFLVSNADEEWEDTGRVWSLELLDRTTVPAQEEIDQTYSLAAGSLILQTVKTILAGCGESITINEASTLATSSGMVWPAGTTKLKIINDLLDVAGYNSLWIDGNGLFQTTPRVLPADRSIKYEVFNINRELVDGEQSIYLPDWQRRRDSFKVPNKVVCVQAATGSDSTALIGSYTNTDPNSPYSTVSRGRTITYTADSIEVPDGTSAEITAFLTARARTILIQMSAVQAQVKVDHLPIPIRVSDVLRFAHTKAGIDARHVITRIQLETSSTGLMASTLQEVISL